MRSVFYIIESVFLAWAFAPILNQATTDPQALIAELASLYPQLDSTALEQQLAQLLFVADIWGRLQAQSDA